MFFVHFLADKFQLCPVWLETGIADHHGQYHGLRMPNEAFFLSKSQTFGLAQTIWADKFWGIWGIFGQVISTHFGTVSPLSMFFINQLLFLQKTKPLYSNHKYLLDLKLGRKELGI